MKRYPILLLMALAGSLLLFSCGNKSNIPVPKDAVLVLQLNSASLSSKLSWKEIKEGDLFKEMYAEVKDTLARKLMEDPENSGVDTKADLIMFVKKQGKSGYVAFEGSLKDAAAFESFVKKATNKGDVATSGDFKTVSMGNDAVVLWNKTNFAFLGDAPMLNALNNFTGSSNGEFPRGLSVDSLVIYGKAIFDIKGSASIGDDDRFTSLLKEPGDLHFWLNGEQYLGDLGSGMMSLMKVNDLFKGNISTGAINFDNGKITIKTKSYVNDQLAALYKKYPSKNLSSEVIDRIPSQNVIAVLGMNYPPEGLKELLKLTGVDGLTNGFLEKANYSIDEFVKANKGELLVAVSDFTMKETKVSIPGYDGGAPTEYTTSQPDVKVLFATSINDKPAFDKLITTLSNQLGNDSASFGKINYQLNKDWFAASNSEEYVTKFLAGGSSKQPFTSRISGSSLALFVDIQKILVASKASSKDSTVNEALELSLKMWQDVISTNGEFSGNSSTGLLEINLVDKSTNSLKQLNKYINEMGLIQKKRNRYNDVEVMEPTVDTTTIAAPPPSVDK